MYLVNYCLIFCLLSYWLLKGVTIIQSLIILIGVNVFSATTLWIGGIIFFSYLLILVIVGALLVYFLITLVTYLQDDELHFQLLISGGDIDRTQTMMLWFFIIVGGKFILVFIEWLFMWIKHGVTFHLVYFPMSISGFEMPTSVGSLVGLWIYQVEPFYTIFTIFLLLIMLIVIALTYYTKKEK